MKKVLLSSCLLFAFAVSVIAQTKPKTATKPVSKTTVKTTAKVETAQFKNLIDSFSYAAGYNVATNMQAQGITQINTVMMNKGVEDVFKKNPARLTPELINSSMQKQLDIFAAEKSLADRSKGIAFLEANKKRKEVITLPSGLQYEVIQNGDANSPMPKSVDTVVVNYIGMLIDGTEFDNSFKRGEPAAFPVMGVIKGWIEILQLMRKGDIWKVYIPSELAYGSGGAAGGAIPPHAVLVFKIVLEDIRPAVTKPAGE
ncbi:MAG: FKBP-type peptidyl-prolyl cis-trans isomerase [Ferruginibacter sp.]